MAKEWQNILDNFSGGKSSTSHSTSSKASSTQNPSNNNWQGILDNFSGSTSRKKQYDDAIAPVASRVITRAQKKKEEEKKKKRKWFEKGLFEDGYDVGDITKTILGTATDALENVGAGIIGMGEKAVDAMAYIAPYAANGQFYQNGGIYDLETENAHKKAVEQSKTELEKFIAKDLYDEEKVARAIISDPARKIGIDSENHSVFGEKSDALIQSGGQLLATAGLQAVGVPWFVTTGVTSFGGETENAMNQGASYEEAGASAAISAGAEILSEKLSGGISFGGKTLDDALTKQISKNISNKVFRTVAKLTSDMGGEGLEEVFSGAISAVGQKLTYADDKELNELFSKEDAWESFIGGAVMGGVAGSYNAVKSNKKGVDYASGLTQNEQKVVDKVYKDRVTEAEKSGKVTEKQKSEIYDKVLSDMDRGYLAIDDIESALGGETYEEYKRVSEWEDGLQNEYNELHAMKRGEMTGEQLDREAHLKEQLKNVKATSSRDSLKSKLSDDVFGLVKGDRLIESYNERTRRGQAFEADLTKYDAKQQATIQKAIDSGILNNTNRTHEFVDIISKISADKGVLFDFTNNKKLKESGFAVDGRQVNGFVTKDGISLNIDSPQAWQKTVGHEVTHVLEGTEFYTELQNTLFEYAKTKGEYDRRMQTLTELYKNVQDADINAELTADLVGEYLFTDENFIKNLSTQNRNVFQKIYDEIKYLYKVATGSKEAKELARVKRAFDKAYKEADNGLSVTKYSISSDGKELTKEQQEFFKDSKIRDENGSLKVMYHGTPNGDFTVFKDGTYFTDNKEYADRYQNPGASSISTGKEAKNPKTFEVYLDIKKPFDINDAEARNIYINDYIKGGNAMGINPYLSDAEYAKINSIDWTEGEDLREFLIENEYDYDGLVLDEGGTGGYGDEVQSRGKSYVVFSPEQVKNVDNLKPSVDPDIRFSLSNPVEETKDLMALHNLTEQKLLKSLKLGGLPMPSVAIAKAKDGHSEFGEISLILPRETIDPETSSRNKLYSGDAWTPTYPKVEYKLNSKALKQIRDKINGLVPANVQEFGRLHLDSDNMEDTLNRYNGDMVDAFKDNDALKYAYLMEAEADVQLPMKEKNLSYSGSRENGAIIKVAEAISAEDISKALNGGHEEIQKLEPIVRKAVAEYVRETYGDDQFILDTFAPAEGLSFSDLDGYLVEARKYHRNGVEQTVDTRPARELIRDMTVQYSYEEWLNNLFSGIVEKEGIRNNKDYFTPSGNRRSFEALHYEHNLENVIKAMREKGEKGIGFGGGSIFGAATTEFSSVDEMKQASGRLQQMSEEEYQEIKDGFTKRFFDLASSLPNDKKSFIATDDAANTLTEAVAKYQTRTGIANYLRRELKGWATYSPQVVDDLIELVNDIRNMPTGYFEAKPQRAVGFDEVAVFVIPYDADVKLKQELLNKGYSIAEYDPKVEGDRQRVVNQFEEFKFSLSNVGEKHTSDSLSALRYDAPVAENATTPTVAENATVQPKTQLTEENATVTAADMQELFPNDAVPVQAELERLVTERDQLYKALEDAVNFGSANDVGRLAAEYEEINSRIKALESTEAERTGSLTDANVPAEMEAPLSMKSENYDPYNGVTLDDINRTYRTYSDRNPGARQYIEEAALGFAYDVNNSTHGERWYNDELYYATGGEKGFGGTSRSTTDDIADLKDYYGYTWEQLRKAADDVVKGEVRSVAAKRVEYLVHKRLMEGYTDVDGRRYEPNQEYITFLNEQFANEQRAGSFDSLLEDADQYAPIGENISPTLKQATPDTFDAPIFESKDKNTVKGQTTMFAPEKPKTSGRVARVLTEESKSKEKSGIGMKAVSAFVDKGMVFENLSLDTGNMEVQAKWNSALPANTEKKAQHFMENGADGVKPLKEIIKDVKKTGKEEAFTDYMYHVHNIDRMSLEDRFGLENKAVFGDTITAEISTKKVLQYEKANPEFKALAESVYAYNKYLRGLLVENGVISQETADLWEKEYPHYVPVRRVDQDGKNINVPLDTNKTGVNAPVKKATGGNSDIEPLFNTMAMRTEQVFSAIARNSFGIELKNTLGSTINTQQNVTGVDDAINLIEDQESNLLKPGSLYSNPTFTVFENGERVEFEITEDMYDALKPAGKLLGHRIDKITKVSEWRRNLLTTWNPVFALWRNPVKDLQDVMINSQHAAKTYAQLISPTKDNVIYQIATHGKWAEEYESNGGKGSTYFDSNNKKFTSEDNIFKKTIGFPLRALENAGEFIEEIPRLAEYIASRKEGRSVDRSMLDAARVTTNFAAGGDVTRFANAHGFTFLNASVQGASQHVRNFREATRQDGMKGFVKTLAKYTLAGIPGIILNNMIWDDDEEYEELSDYVKQNYYVVAKTNDGKFIRIPKGRTAAVMNNALEQMQHLITGDGEADFSTFYELFMNNIAPNNPVENNILAPIMQVKNNRAWYGDDLVPTRLQDLPAEEQFDESTDALSKWLGEKTGTSPYKWNYLLDQYSGGIGDMILPMMTPEAESGDNTLVGNMPAPWKKELTTDSVLNNKNPGNFYDLKDELDIVSNGKNATEEDKMRSMYLESVSWDMGELYAQKREIQNSDLPDDRKYEQVREIQEQINELANNALNKYNHVRINGAYAEAGDRRYDYNADKDKWYEITPTNADGSDNWYYIQEQLSHDKLGMSYDDFWNGKQHTEGGTYYAEYNGKRYNYDADKSQWYEIVPKNDDGTDNWYYQMEQEVTKGLGISYEEYWSKPKEYNYAYEQPGKYAISQSVGGYDSWVEYQDVLENWKSDNYIKDANGDGQRKDEVRDYIFGLDIDYGQKVLLYRSVYTSKKDKRKYNQDIIDYLNERDDISYQEMKTILEELEMEVDSEGYITW